MAGVKLTVTVAALVLSGALASVAHADPLAIDPSKALTSQWSAPLTQHKSFEYDVAKSRWGLKFDVEQQPGLGTDWKNVQAGAFFKITPSLRVGAGVSLSETQSPSSTGNALAQPPAPPRVHLETAFKF
jgi:hypothetical protein